MSDPITDFSWKDMDAAFDAMLSEVDPRFTPKVTVNPEIPPVSTSELRAYRAYRSRQRQNMIDAASKAAGKVSVKRVSPERSQVKFKDGTEHVTKRTSPVFQAGVAMEHPDHPNDYRYLYHTRTGKPRQWFWLNRQGTLPKGTRAYLSIPEAVMDIARDGWLDASWTV